MRLSGVPLVLLLVLVQAAIVCGAKSMAGQRNDAGVKLQEGGGGDFLGAIVEFD